MREIAAWETRDWRVSALLAGIPSVVLAAAAIAGYPLITGDDLVQNYPLEVLSGRLLRGGHIPLWDSYLWSGTPLLGGTNAHSFLPITWLFAFLPPVAAWVAGEAMVFALAAVGVQLFLRRTGCHSLAAGLGGATFGLGGFFSSQIVHIDFASAAVSLPWALVALDGLATRATTSRPWHGLLLAGAVTWLCLAGSPDIVIDAVIACGSYCLHLLLQSRRPASTASAETPMLRLGWLAWAALSGVAGLGVGALQWLPAARFVDVSQRAHPSLSFIEGGSLTASNFLELLVPHVLGGGSFGMRTFGGTFPLAEVDAYPGTLALMAIFALLWGCRRPNAHRWRVWLVVAGVSLLVAAGGHTPLEHVLAALPITGSERLPSRALIGVALAAAMCAGYFVEDLVTGATSRGQLRAACVPLAGIAAVILATVATSRPAGGALVAHVAGWSVVGVLPYFAVSLFLGLAGVALMVAANRVPNDGSGHRRRLAAGIIALVAVDLVTFNANQSSLVPTRASSLNPQLAAQVRRLVGDSRFVVIDPALSNSQALGAIGAPDLGVVSGLADAGGYGSLMWSDYDLATGTHLQDGVALRSISNQTMAGLGVKVIFVLPAAGYAPLGTKRQLAEALSAGGYHHTGELGAFDVYSNTHSVPMVRISQGATVHIVSNSAATGKLVVTVDAKAPAQLIRSVADVPGWLVSVRSAGRTTTSSPIAVGVTQSVAVPIGISTVTFVYEPPGWRAAQLLAAIGTLILLGLLAFGTVARRRSGVRSSLKL